jgi:hypothetical protein
MLGELQKCILVQCPYCFEQVELFVDPESEGSMVEDCSVCCQPWQLYVSRSGGELQVSVERAQ